MEQSNVQTITTEALISIVDQTWTELMTALETSGNVLDRGSNTGEWTPREVLSHIVGAWQRIPVHTAFFLSRQPQVPIVFGDPFWIPEWETAPLDAFKWSLYVAYAGCRAFIRQLTPEDLACVCKTPLGKMSLGEFLVTCFVFHIGDMHTPQLAALHTETASDPVRSDQGPI